MPTFGGSGRTPVIQPWVAEKIGQTRTPVAAGPPASQSTSQAMMAQRFRVAEQTPSGPGKNSETKSPDQAAPSNSEGLQLGPRKLYPRPEGTDTDLPLVIRDAIQFSETGTRLLATKPRIVGGEPAPAGAYPWIASLTLKGADTRDGFFCGGAFIAPDWVMTAAHCVQNTSADEIQVHGGSNTLASGGALYPVDRIIVNEKYDDGTQDNDVALLHLAARFTGQTSRLLTAADANRYAPVGALATTIGWGVTTEDGDVSNILRHVKVQIVSNKACNAAYDNTISDVMLCAGFAKGGKDACQGDSGRPLVVSDGRGGYFQAGIVSWGEGCAHPNKYGVYTRVSVVQPWVAGKVGGRAVEPVAGPQRPRPHADAVQIYARQARPPLQPSPPLPAWAEQIRRNMIIQPPAEGWRSR